MREDGLDWSGAAAAYGPATEVPGLLAQLSSPQQSERQAAIEGLWSSLCHQETVYEASALAVPGLFRAARGAALTDAERDTLLALIAAIGRGEDTCWEGYTSWQVVQQCEAAVERLLPDFLEWARHGDASARRWTVALATYFPARFRTLGADVTDLVAVPDPPLLSLISEIVAGVEPDGSLIDAVAARDEDTLDWLRDGLAGQPRTRQGRQVVWDLAQKSLL